MKSHGDTSSSANRAPEGAPSYPGPVLVGSSMTFVDVTTTEVLLYCGEFFGAASEQTTEARRGEDEDEVEDAARATGVAVAGAAEAAALLRLDASRGGIGPCPLLAEHVLAMTRWPRLSNYLTGSDRRPVGDEAYRGRVAAVLDPLREAEAEIAKMRAEAATDVTVGGATAAAGTDT